ncbi:MAG: glycosyltransferase family A protein [Nostocaceae cyanobacterium]|nr:glycosyltransferase family A protein [Nostocaceae cyanobacterium]
MPKVTVVIPTYNSMTYLPAAMETALSQTFTDFEVLVVNDGSTDGTVEWVSQLTDPRVRMISQANQGLAGARNTGVTNAQGDYIAFLDADDLWEATKLEKQVRCLDENPAVGVVYTWTALADENGKPTGRLIASHAEGNVWRQLLEFNIVGSGSTPLIRKQCFESVGLFFPDVSPSDDRDMWLRISQKFSFAVVKEPLIYYRQHPHNSTKKCQVMLEKSRILIERAFQSAPTELLYLRNRSYGSAYLYLGWKAIENRDAELALQFYQQACYHCPQLFFSPKCIRLGIAIALIRLFSPQFYSQVIALVYALRQGLITARR